MEWSCMVTDGLSCETVKEEPYRIDSWELWIVSLSSSKSFSATGTDPCRGVSLVDERELGEDGTGSLFFWRLLSSCTVLSSCPSWLGGFWWIFMCLFKWSLRMNLLLQISHWNFFRPCAFSCDAGAHPTLWISYHKMPNGTRTAARPCAA